MFQHISIVTSVCCWAIGENYFKARNAIYYRLVCPATTTAASTTSRRFLSLIQRAIHLYFAFRHVTTASAASKTPTIITIIIRNSSFPEAMHIDRLGLLQLLVLPCCCCSCYFWSMLLLLLYFRVSFSEHARKTFVKAQHELLRLLIHCSAIAGVCGVFGMG